MSILSKMELCGWQAKVKIFEQKSMQAEWGSLVILTLPLSARRTSGILHAFPSTGRIPETSIASFLPLFWRYYVGGHFLDLRGNWGRY